MAGIASDRGGSINTAPIANFGETNAAPKGIGDLMAAFREGFITVDDLMKRGLAAPAEFAAAGQNTADQLQLRPLARQQQIGALSADIALQPKRALNAVAAEDLRAGQIAAATEALPTLQETEATRAERTKSAQLRNALASDVPAVKEQAIANLSTDQLYNTWTASHGQPPPEQIEVANFDPTFQPKPIEDWIIENYGQSALAQDAQAVINRPDIQAGYANYAKSAKNRPLTYFKGSPEYDAKLRSDLKAADLKIAIQGAELKALPGMLEAKAKATAEGPAKLLEAQNKAQSDVLAELHKSEALKRFEPQFEAFEKVDAIRNSGRQPTNADDIAVLYEFVKLLDPTSAVREGEAKLAQSTVPLVKRVYHQTLGIFVDHNKIIDPQARNSMFATMDSLKQGALQTAAPEIKRITNIAIDRGVPLDQVFTGPYQAVLTGGRPGAGAPPPNGKRVLQNGVTFEWNGTKYVPVQ